MNIDINTIDELLTFIKRKEVSTKDAINVFKNAFDVTCILFIDAITRELCTDKEMAINTIEEYISKVKADNVYSKIVIFRTNN